LTATLELIVLSHHTIVTEETTAEQAGSRLRFSLVLSLLLGRFRDLAFLPRLLFLHREDAVVLRPLSIAFFSFQHRSRSERQEVKASGGLLGLRFLLSCGCGWKELALL
jgi:hypothetical protein